MSRKMSVTASITEIAAVAPGDLDSGLMKLDSTPGGGMADGVLASSSGVSCGNDMLTLNREWSRAR